MPPEHPSEHLVVVYVCHNPAELPVVQSVLEDAGIRFMVKGEPIQSMFGIGQLGGTNLALGPVEIYVLASDVEAARSILMAEAGLSFEDES